MRLRTFSSIGGLLLYGNPASPREQHFNNRLDVLELKVHRDDLSDLAVGMIEEIGADASPELIAKCRELVEFADEQQDPTGEELTEGQIAFIQRLEDNAGESKRDHERMVEYYKRLESDYGAPPI